MKKHLYLISGMGADERIFRNLRFPDTYQTHFLRWLDPLPDEPYSDYAARMAQGIPHEQFSLLGTSFGGILSIEIARQRPVEKVVLISSLKTTRERPTYFNLVKKTGLLRLLSLPDAIVFKHRKFFVQPFFKPETLEEKELLEEYMAQTDYDYMRWAIRTLINWENEFVPLDIVHIHGDGDTTLPIHTVKPDYVISKGSHFMVLNRAKEINEILSRELAV
jgi:pimeloyl-ACP methyl ester carboxylesterase